MRCYHEWDSLKVAVKFIVTAIHHTVIIVRGYHMEYFMWSTSWCYSQSQLILWLNALVTFFPLLPPFKYKKGSWYTNHRMSQIHRNVGKSCDYVAVKATTQSFQYEASKLGQVILAFLVLSTSYDLRRGLLGERDSKGGYLDTILLLGPLNIPFQVERTRIFRGEDISFALHQLHRVKPEVVEHREGVDLCLSTAEIPCLADLHIPCKTPFLGHVCLT